MIGYTELKATKTFEIFNLGIAIKVFFS